MRDYGKVHTSFWTSQNVRAMSDDGRALALYLLTCPHGTIAGVFRLPDGYACEDLQWGAERVQQGFVELFANGFAKRCGTTKWVWVLKHFDWNPPENPNQRKAAAKVASQVADACDWKQEFMRVCGRYMGVNPVADDEPFQNGLRTLLESGAVTGVGTGTEAVLEEVIESGGASSLPAKPPAATKGTRLKSDWALPKAWGDWALSDRKTWTPEQVRRVSDMFRDHWTSQPGQRGVRLDWQATWRNWVRKEADPKNADKSLITVPATPAICACCGSSASLKIGQAWYCRNHDQYSERKAA